jgi:hypothetical protein
MITFQTEREAVAGGGENCIMMSFMLCTVHQISLSLIFVQIKEDGIGRILEGNIEMDFKETKCEDMDCIKLRIGSSVKFL